MDVTCTSKGDNGDHCCYMGGGVCQYLDETTIRCTIFETAPNVEGYDDSPVGKYFAEFYPGYTCRDWPQNIPEAPNQCCWADILKDA